MTIQKNTEHRNRIWETAYSSILLESIPLAGGASTFLGAAGDTFSLETGFLGTAST